MGVDIPSRRLTISDHAIDRYRERWMSPASTTDEAIEELAQLVALAAPLVARTMKKGDELWLLGEVRAVVRRDPRLRSVVIVTILPRTGSEGGPLPAFEPDEEEAVEIPPAPPPRAVLPVPTAEEIAAADVEVKAALRDQADAIALAKEAKTWEAETNKRVNATRERLRWLKTRASQARLS